MHRSLFKYKFVRRSGDHREIGSEGAAPAFGRAYRILRPTPNNGLPLGGRIVTARIREQILDTLLAKPQRPETS